MQTANQMATVQGELTAALNNTQTATTLPTALLRTSELEHETKRLGEQLGVLRKKYGRAKAAGGGVDDVLEEELSEMKKMFTCGACNQRQKVRGVGAALQLSGGALQLTCHDVFYIGHRHDQVFPCVLPRVHRDQSEHAAAQVPAVH